MNQAQNSEERLDQLIHRALNKTKRPSTAEEITDLLNRELRRETGRLMRRK